jgi:hypothetical protein
MDSLGATFEREEAKDRAMGDSDEGGFLAYIMQQRASERSRMQRQAGRFAARRNWNW